MKTKKCFKCGEDKPLSEFYVHKQMADGHLGKCKSCTKADVTKHRNENLEKIRAYDNERSTLKHRRDLAIRSQKKRRSSNPLQYKAHCAVNNAVRDGRLNRPEKCEVCGCECTPHGHHWSYEPENRLDVEWLCIHCHVSAHAKTD